MNAILYSLMLVGVSVSFCDASPDIGLVIQGMNLSEGDKKALLGAVKILTSQKADTPRAIQSSVELVLKSGSADVALYAFNDPSARWSSVYEEKQDWQPLDIKIMMLGLLKFAEATDSSSKLNVNNELSARLLSRYIEKALLKSNVDVSQIALKDGTRGSAVQWIQAVTEKALLNKTIVNELRKELKDMNSSL
ncbi:MAG TPA: hypothetical protein VK970_03455 [Candidatus Methylacidiphilales bacterium]|nr:hypothetical protein [Candidatus Methylacidiphilales bacterium]